MATKDFLLPDLGEGLTEGEVVSWLVSVGDVVELDQNVAEIETAKAVVEVPSPFAGTVVALHGEPGEEVMVGAPLITIDVGGEDAAAEEEGPSAMQPAFEVGEAAAASEADAAAEAEEEDSGSVLLGRLCGCGRLVGVTADVDGDELRSDGDLVPGFAVEGDHGPGER